MKKLLLKAVHEIEREMCVIGFINDSDDTDRLIDEIADDLIPIEEDERTNQILKEMLEDHMVENYKIVREVDNERNYKGYYYDTEKEYENIHEFKKDYEIN